MLMNEKNKEMERWESLVTLLSSILFFVFVCLVTRHPYEISALVFQTSFRGETVGAVAKCRLFSQANLESKKS